MSMITKASHQWATRPADQRFLSLLDLQSSVVDARNRSTSRVAASRNLEALAVDGDYKGLLLAGATPSDGPVEMTHWSFGQLAELAKCPAGYLRTLPGPLAADCINYGLQYSRDVEDVGILTYTNGSRTLRAATGPAYGRVWNADLIEKLIERFGDGVTGDFRVPGEFGKPVPITKDNTTLYASDRDMFVFLADEQHRIELPNRRNGETGLMARGFFVWNSEVGSKTFGIATFLFDYVCCNRIVWGAEEYQEFNIRHTASAPVKFIEQVAPAIEAYANSGTTGIVKAIEDARSKRIDDVDTFLKNRKFSRASLGAIKAAHMADEQRPMETLYDVANGITAYARSVQYQDERVALEREAGKIMKLAA